MAPVDTGYLDGLLSVFGVDTRWVRMLEKEAIEQRGPTITVTKGVVGAVLNTIEVLFKLADDPLVVDAMHKGVLERFLATLQERP